LIRLWSSYKLPSGKKEVTVADNSEAGRRLESGTVKPERGVLRARDVIPHGSTETERKVIIPKFDLSREIMAGQRKTTAEKRQSPGEKLRPPEQQADPQGRDYPVERLRGDKTQADEVMAKIVARDIARLCGTEP
jgi:hypothetical protein